YHPVECRADDKGRYRIIPPVGKFVTVLAYPAAREPYLLRRKTFTWAKGSTYKQGMDLTLRRGIAVEGRITETPSGKPVGGATVQFLWRSDNPFARDDLNVFLGGAGLEQPGVSGPDGKVQFPILPGPGHLVIKGPSADYLHTSITTKELYGPGVTHIRNPHYPDAVVALNLKPDQRSHQVAVTLRRGVTVKGEIVAPDGKPVARALTLCDFYIPDDYHLNPAYPREARDGRFELPGCDPEKGAPVYFLDPKSQFGAVVRLSGKDASDKGVKIRLQPCGQATVRFANDKGQPMRDLRFNLSLVIKSGDTGPFTADTISTITADMLSLDGERYQKLQVDAEGRVTFPTLIPGAKDQVRANAGGMRGYRIVGEFTAESSKTVDLKTIKMKNDE